MSPESLHKLLTVSYALLIASLSLAPSLGLNTPSPLPLHALLAKNWPPTALGAVGILAAGALLGLSAYLASLLSVGLLGVLAVCSVAAPLEVPFTYATAFRVSALLSIAGPAVFGFSDSVSMILAIRERVAKSPRSLARFSAYSLAMGAVPLAAVIASSGMWAVPLEVRQLSPSLMGLIAVGAPLLAYLRTGRVKMDPLTVVLTAGLASLSVAILPAVLLPLAPAICVILPFLFPKNLLIPSPPTLPALVRPVIRPRPVAERPKPKPEEAALEPAVIRLSQALKVLEVVED